MRLHIPECRHSPGLGEIDTSAEPLGTVLDAPERSGSFWFPHPVSCDAILTRSLQVIFRGREVPGCVSRTGCSGGSPTLDVTGTPGFKPMMPATNDSRLSPGELDWTSVPTNRTPLEDSAASRDPQGRDGNSGRSRGDCSAISNGSWYITVNNGWVFVSVVVCHWWLHARGGQMLCAPGRCVCGCMLSLNLGVSIAIARRQRATKPPSATSVCGASTQRLASMAARFSPGSCM